MDPTRFDTLARVLSAPDSRRRVLGLLTAVPVVGGLLGLLMPEETEGKGRRKRRKKAHKHGKGRRRKHGNHQRKPTCTPTTCAEQGKTCGSIPDGCGKTLDCGACTCTTGCPTCQTCNPATDVCDDDPNDTPCDDGDACTQTDRCQNGTCVGRNPVVCTPLDACHVAGTCNPATGVCSDPERCPAPQVCAGSACCTAAGNTATSGVPCCAGLNTCADGTCRADCCAGVTCGACLTCQGGDCVADAAQDGTCCAGATGQQWCQSGQCVVIPSDARATLLACGGRCFFNFDAAFHDVCGTVLKCFDCLDCASAPNCVGEVPGYGPAGFGFYCYNNDGFAASCEGTGVCPSPSSQLCESSGYCFNICFG